MADRSRILVVASERLESRTIKRRGVPTLVHERVMTFALACGHEVTRRYPINQGTTKTRTKLLCPTCAAEEGENAA